MSRYAAWRTFTTASKTVFAYNSLIVYLYGAARRAWPARLSQAKGRTRTAIVPTERAGRGAVGALSACEPAGRGRHTAPIMAPIQFFRPLLLPSNQLHPHLVWVPTTRDMWYMLCM